MMIKIKNEVKEYLLKLLGFERSVIKRTTITYCGDEKTYTTIVDVEYNYIVDNHTIATIYPNKVLDLHTYEDTYVFELAELIYRMGDMLEFIHRGYEEE